MGLNKGANNMEKCFACGRKLGETPMLVDTRDDQLVYVGRECAKLVIASGEAGYQPPLGGPRLYALAQCKTKQELEQLRVTAGEIVRAHNVVGGILKSGLQVANMICVRGTADHAIAALAAQKAIGQFVYHSDEHGRITMRRPYASRKEGSK